MRSVFTRLLRYEVGDQLDLPQADGARRQKQRPGSLPIVFTGNGDRARAKQWITLRKPEVEDRVVSTRLRFLQLADRPSVEVRIFSDHAASLAHVIGDLTPLKDDAMHWRSGARRAPVRPSAYRHHEDGSRRLAVTSIGA